MKVMKNYLRLLSTEFRTRYDSHSKEVIVPFDLNVDDSAIKFTVPKLGEKKKLLDLSHKNVQFFKKEKIDQYEKLNPEIRTERLLTTDDEGFADEPAAKAY